MLKINLENELLKIEKNDIDLRIKKAIINPTIESKIFKIKKINYISIIALFIIGVIIICIGAFFQNTNQKPIMISCIIVGVVVLISMLIPAFIAPWISFKILKSTSIKQINESFLSDVFIILCAQIETLNVKNILFIEEYIQINFIINDDFYLLTKEENQMILRCNNKIINSTKLMKYFSKEIKYKLSVIDLYKQSNIENFVDFISDEIKYKIQMILKDISFMIDSKKGVQNENN